MVGYFRWLYVGYTESCARPDRSLVVVSDKVVFVCVVEAWLIKDDLQTRFNQKWGQNSI